MAGVAFQLHADRGFDRLVRALLRLPRDAVRAGVLGAPGEAPHSGSQLTNAKLAAIHEFGSPARGIPERSFIRSSLAAHREEYLLMLRHAAGEVYRLKTADLGRALNLIGLKMAADIKWGITAGAGIPPPLAAETIARKGSDRPLVDTGQLVNSITWEVVLRGS